MKVTFVTVDTFASEKAKSVSELKAVNFLESIADYKSRTEKE